MSAVQATHAPAVLLTNAREWWRGLPDRRRAVIRVLLVYSASRFAVWLGAVAASALRRNERSALEVFTTWDAHWYLRIVTDGYPHSVPIGENGDAVYSTIPFFPVFPGITKLATYVSPLTDASTIVFVTLAIGALAAVALWLTAAHLADAALADRAVLLFCFAPGALTLSFAYAEGTMLVLAMASLWALHERRWLLAGVAGMVATASRPNAIVLVACAAWAAGWAIWKHRDWWSLIAPVLTPLGAIGFIVWIGDRTGESEAWFRVQREAWDERFDWGNFTSVAMRDFLVRPFEGDVRALIIGLGGFVTVILLVMLQRARLPGVYNIFALGIIGLAVTSAVLGPRPRFLFTAFPLTIAAAKYLRGQVLTVVVALLCAGMVAMTIMYGYDWPVLLISPPP
jgi:hypothetical protein